MSDLVTRQVSALPAGTAFNRFLNALVVSRGDTYTAKSLASTWPGLPHVARAFDLDLKAAVAPGTTSDNAWAGVLVATGIAAEVGQLLRALTVIGQLDGKLSKVPFNTIVPYDTATTGLGAFVAQGAPLPAGAGSFVDLGPLPLTKAGVIVTLTQELVTATDGASEATVRRSVLGRLAKSIDELFLLPTNAGVPDVTPASITNGATAIASSGSSAAQIAADLAAMAAAVTTSVGRRVWILREGTLNRVAGALGATSGLPATLLGSPVIVSPNSPPQITFVDTGAILLADEGGFDVSVSRQASPRLDTAPTAATPPTSLWQSNLIGIRPIRWIHWLRAEAGAVSYMTVAY